MSKKNISPDVDSSVGTIELPGVGEVASPSELAESNRHKNDTQHQAVPDECPVQTCNADGFNDFKSLRAHFGGVGDAAHKSYDLSIEDYQPDSE